MSHALPTRSRGESPAGASHAIRVLLQRGQSLLRHRHFFWSLVDKELKVRYAQSLLGVAWAMIEPMLLVFAMSTIYAMTGADGPQGAPFPVFFYSGVLPWQLFRRALVDGCSAFIDDQNLWSKMSYPREISILKDVTVDLVELGAASVAFGIVLAIYGYGPNIYWLFLPLLVVLQVAICTGIMLITASVTVYLRDVAVLMRAFGALGFWFTPIVFDFPYSGSTKVLFFLNPMVGIIKSYRSIILSREMPQWSFLLPAVAMSGLLLLIGALVFLRLEKDFVDVL